MSAARIDATHPALQSWVESANDPHGDFPIQNLPFGRSRRGDEMDWRIGVAIGNQVLDLRRARLIDSYDMNRLMRLAREPRLALRRAISSGLAIGSADRAGRAHADLTNSHRHIDNEETSMIRGKAALVTGSTSGIGLAIARKLASQGASVMLNGFGDAGEIEQLRNSLAAEHGVRVEHSGADVAKGDQVQALVALAEETFGALDIVVNNAGIQHVSPVDEFPPEKWEQIIAINLSSNFYAIRAALPGMKKRGFGRIVNIASAHGLVASPFKSAYVAAKHGVIGLTKTVALEVAETPITCNAICPGYVRTPLVDTQIRDQAKVHNLSEERVIKEVLLAAQPNKRFVASEAIGDLVLFLCSPAADSLTGAALPIDGGWTAR